MIMPKDCLNYVAIYNMIWKGHNIYYHNHDIEDCIDYHDIYDIYCTSLIII